MNLFWLIVVIISVSSIGFGVAFVCYLVFVEKAYNSRIWKMPKIEDGKPTRWGWIVRHPERLVLGENTDIGAFTYIQALNGVWIGKNVKIGAHCAVYSVDTIDNRNGEIYICDNACIGAGSVILPCKDGKPLVIGKNSVVGALSLVYFSVGENLMVAGVPAKVIAKQGVPGLGWSDVNTEYIYD